MKLDRCNGGTIGPYREKQAAAVIMSSKHFYFSSNPLRCKGFKSELRTLLFLQLILIVISTTIIAATATADDMYTVTADSGSENRTNRRWFSGIDRRHDDRDGINSDSSYWKEVVDRNNNHKNSHDYMEGSNIQKHRPKNRLGLFHFGRISQLSVFEANNNNSNNNNNQLNNDNSNKEEHPLRTNLWEMNLKWSYLSPNSKILSRTSERKRKRREKVVQLELDPEGYCRIIESTITKNNHDQDCSNSPVLGIGRWKKRPWGVTIVVRPLCILESSLDSTNVDDDGDRRRDNKTYSKDKKNGNIIDEQTEFIFHANNFHWNGFGSNPKLTQGTILLQKQKKKKKNTCWWKSTTWAYSSILPVWPEELSGENDDDQAVANGARDISFGSVCSDLLRFSGIFNVGNKSNISTRRSWFRPVVGTFTAKGITRK